MQYRRYQDWTLLKIGDDYDLKSVGEFLDDFKIGNVRTQWLAGNILLNSKPVTEEIYLRKGDTLQIKAFPSQEVDFAPSGTLPEVVYEDDFLLIVNKPRGEIIYPAAKEGNGTLANDVATYYLEKGIHTTVRPIHRLDKETTGLVIFSKSPFLQPKLDWMLMHKEIKRYYYAFVEGRITEDGVIDQPIARDRHEAGKMRVSREGKKAVTHYRVVRTMKNFTLLEVLLDTGRTHQIRVHMKYIGHPVVNDTLYGEPYDNLPMGLQAFRIVFEHPILGKTVRAEVACDF